MRLFKHFFKENLAKTDRDDEKSYICNSTFNFEGS